MGREVMSGQSKELDGKLFRAHRGDIVFSKVDAKNGAVVVAPESLDVVAFAAE